MDYVRVNYRYRIFKSVLGRTTDVLTGNCRVGLIKRLSQDTGVEWSIRSFGGVQDCDYAEPEGVRSLLEIAPHLSAFIRVHPRPILLL